MKTPSELHDEAMRLAEEAFDASRRGKSDRAHRLFLKALENERSAAEAFEHQFDVEPTRSVLYRSAATLAFHAGLPNESIRLIAAGLSGNPPREIKQELKDLQKQVGAQRRTIKAIKALASKAKVSPVKRATSRIKQVKTVVSKFAGGEAKVSQVKKVRFRYKQVNEPVSKSAGAKIKEPVRSTTKTREIAVRGDKA